MLIPLEKIDFNPNQPRKLIDPDQLNELAESIEINGLLQPILVEETLDGRYLLIAGERRTRACRLVGLTEIEAVVRPSLNGRGPIERAVLAIVENFQRVSLTPIEEARAIQQLVDLGLSNAAIAHRLGTSLPTVTNRLRLLDLPVEIQSMVEHGMWPVDKRAADAILSVPADRRVRLAQKLARPALGIQAVLSAVERYQSAVAAEKISDSPALTLSARRAGQVDLPRWDALRQLGHLLPWSVVTRSTERTCSNCALRESASTVVCGSCPLVSLLTTLIDTANRKE